MTRVRLGTVPVGARVRLPRGQTGVLVSWETKDVVLVRLDTPRPAHRAGRFTVLSSGCVRVRIDVMVEELAAA